MLFSDMSSVAFHSKLKKFFFKEIAKKQEESSFQLQFYLR
ncbi:hypothetical protein RV17_GL000604 [Enterococcus thailandicus]|nr:hypothetical protein RV17_GL000604 [Enterococcus thailandicus]